MNQRYEIEKQFSRNFVKYWQAIGVKVETKIENPTGIVSGRPETIYCLRSDLKLAVPRELFDSKIVGRKAEIMPKSQRKFTLKDLSMV